MVCPPFFARSPKCRPHAGAQKQNRVRLFEHYTTLFRFSRVFAEKKEKFTNQARQTPTPAP
jgi:hypothetical protein